jgi:hypothetical protein
MLAACFIANPGWSSITLIVIALFLVNYALRLHLRRNAPQPNP